MVYRTLVLLAALAAAANFAPQPAAAQTAGLLPTNYYAPAGSPAGVTAQMYPSPRPTPPLVGYTYIPYRPLAPQQFLYAHRNVYLTGGGGNGLTRTTVSYGYRSRWWLFQPSVMFGQATPHARLSLAPSPCVGP